MLQGKEKCKYDCFGGTKQASNHGNGNNQVMVEILTVKFKED